jgi:hypothetical protein
VHGHTSRERQNSILPLAPHKSPVRCSVQAGCAPFVEITPTDARGLREVLLGIDRAPNALRCAQHLIDANRPRVCPKSRIHFHVKPT